MKPELDADTVYNFTANGEIKTTLAFASNAQAGDRIFLKNCKHDANNGEYQVKNINSVSYTHLTLPTIYSV